MKTANTTKYRRPKESTLHDEKKKLYKYNRIE